MKTQGKCSKCGCSDVLRVPGEIGVLGGNSIRVGATMLSAVPVTRFVCAACGYVEEWIDNAVNLASLAKRYGGKGK
jgi:predicted nucleic-acid-binding Zn-ribbon protein